jgi:hypothetical protein
MNIGVLLIITLAVGLVVLIMLPRVRGISRSEKTTIERRKNGDRRRRHIRVPVDRRRRNRRAQDAAQAFVDRLTN